MPEVSFFTAYYIYGLLRGLLFATLKLRKPIRKTAASQLAFCSWIWLRQIGTRKNGFMKASFQQPFPECLLCSAYSPNTAL